MEIHTDEAFSRPASVSKSGGKLGEKRAVLLCLQHVAGLTRGAD